MAKVKLVKGKANVTIEPKMGEHKIEVLYDGNDYDFEHDPLTWYLDPFLDYYEPLYKGEAMSFCLPADANGKLTVKLNNKTYTPKIYKGNASFVPSVLTFGWNHATVTYKGTDYGPYEENISFWIKPKVNVGHGDNQVKAPLDPWTGATPRNNINISASDYMTIDLESKSSGKYVVVIDDDYYSEGKFVNGFANISLSRVKLGIQEIYVDYEYEKGKHDFINFYANIKKSPGMSVTAAEVYEGQNVKISVKASKDISDNLIVNVNKKNYTVKMGSGKADLKIPNLAAGTYTVSIKYAGDRNFAGDNVKTSVKVLPKLSPKLTVSVSDIEKGQIEVINVATDKEINANVLVNVNNINHTVKLVNGQGSLNVSGLAPNNYVVRATFNGNAKYLKQSVNATFKVTYVPKITAKSTSVLYTAKGKYSVTVYGTDGKAAKNVYVVFKIGKKQVAKVKTNSRGVATYTVTKTPGSYKISATALGKTVTKKLTVKHVVTLKTVKVKKSAKQLVLTATLKKVNGKYLKKKSVTFKFNGKKYTAKTNKKGVAKVTIKKTVLKKLKVGKKVTYQATYLKDTVKKSVKVKK